MCFTTADHECDAEAETNYGVARFIAFDGTGHRRSYDFERLHYDHTILCFAIASNQLAFSRALAAILMPISKDLINSHSEDCLLSRVIHIAACSTVLCARPVASSYLIRFDLLPSRFNLRLRNVNGRRTCLAVSCSKTQNVNAARQQRLAKWKTTEIETVRARKLVLLL